MDTRWQRLYDQFQAALDLCQQNAGTEIQQAEESFQVAMDYWRFLREAFIASPANTKAQEITFFKKIKPLFTCHIEYYLLLSQALLFLPADTTAQKLYWKNEAERCERFYLRHETFIGYYDGGTNEKDEAFFSAIPDIHHLLPAKNIYEDADCHSEYDNIVRRLLAHRMYNDYLLKKIFL